MSDQSVHKDPVSLRNKVGNVLRLCPPAHKAVLFVERIIKFHAVAKLADHVRSYLGDTNKIIYARDTTYLADGFATTHFVAFLSDVKFTNAFKEASTFRDSVNEKREAKDIRWRAHIATWAAQQAVNLDGDFIECGVNYGLLSKTICEYLNFESLIDKSFYLIDTWGDPNNEAANHVSYSDDIFDTVRERFKKYNNVKLVRGCVPDILESIDVEKIAYLSIDMNGYLAERKTLEKYYELVVPGGIIYFDDYGWGYPKLRQTIDDFFKDKPESLLHFPSGNSIIVKL